MSEPLTIEHRKYIARETAVSTAINVVLSLVFAMAVARGRTAIPLWGAQGIAVDFIPQTFMMMFAMTWAVTLLARKRMRTGQVASRSKGGSITAYLPQNAFLRAMAVGLILGSVMCPLSAGALHLFGFDELSAPTFIAMKTLYGAVLTLIVAPVIVSAALEAPSDHVSATGTLP
jgi:hypothetical protein